MFDHNTNNSMNSNMNQTSTDYNNHVHNTRMGMIVVLQSNGNAMNNIILIIIIIAHNNHNNTMLLVIIIEILIIKDNIGQVHGSSSQRIAHRHSIPH